MSDAPSNQPSRSSPSWLSARRAPVDHHVEPHEEHTTTPHPSTPSQSWSEHLLSGLTVPQRDAVTHTEGPMLVLAAAGSGKTRVITRRIAYLVSQGIPPWSILAVTFTNKAAREMRERVLHLLGGVENQRARGLTVTTFHALCARLLRRYHEQAGLRSDFTIYDAGDQSALMKKVIESLQLSTGNFPPRSVLAAISHAKNQLIDASGYAARAHDFSTRHIARIYQAYEKALRAASAADFDDLLLLTAKLLAGNEQVRAEIRRRWQYLLIDEYQDTNKAQLEIARAIAGSSGDGPCNICVVGDPDQSIYAWRGADLSNILDFEEHYPACRVVMLGENFRSRAPILKAADSLIRTNKRRKHKDLYTSRPGGDKVEALLCRDERAEAAAVVDWFRSLREKEGEHAYPWKGCAVLYRTNALSRVLEEAFRSANVPYTVARGTAFYEREEVKNALAYLRLIANHADDVSLERIVNTPARGISDATVERIEHHARAKSLPMLRAMRGADETWGLTTRALNSIRAFVQLIDSWSGVHNPMLTSATQTTLADLVDRVLRESGLEAMYRKRAGESQSPTDEERLDNLAELVSSARQFELEFDQGEDASSGEPAVLHALRAFLESVSLVADADTIDPETGSVTLMTLHAAKGLEFPAVAIVGLEEGLLPHMRAVTSQSENEMEEERRLCFVGITRAMHRLLLTAARTRTLRGVPERTVPSRFLAEMDPSSLHATEQRDAIDDDASWDAPAPRPARASGLAAQFPPGCSVRHPQFGIGVVRSVTGGSNSRAVIAFRDVGTKTLVLEYARLTRVDRAS